MWWRRFACSECGTQKHHTLPRLLCASFNLPAQAGQPAFYVPQYLQSAGVEVVPVPVFYPDVTHILGQQVYRRVQDVPGVCVLDCISAVLSL